MASEKLGALDPLRESAHAQAKSGAAAVLATCKRIDDAIEHSKNLQYAVDDIRRFIEGKHTVGAVEIRNLLESHHV